MEESLHHRLLAAGWKPIGDLDPEAAFASLLAAEGYGATLDDRLALEAAARGESVDSLPTEARRRAMLDFYGHRWEGFENVGEERGDEIVVVAYDPAWPVVFAEWERRLAKALGDVAVRIEHVGSTAVPGLAAKPVVDIQVGVLDLEDEERYVPKIGDLGVALRSRDAEHRYFRPSPGRPREVHIHVCTVDGIWESEHLLFRDYLRAHDEARDAYAVLKRTLADRFADDRLAYTEAKGEFIRKAMRAAEGWLSEGPEVTTGV